MYQYTSLNGFQRLISLSLEFSNATDKIVDEILDSCPVLEKLQLETVYWEGSADNGDQQTYSKRRNVKELGIRRSLPA